MITCLLCPSPAVADCLCVVCGAKVWAAQLWEREPITALYRSRQVMAGDLPDVGSEERVDALRAIPSAGAAECFLETLKAARTQRAAA